MQNQQPVAFFSHTLSPQARLESVYKRELMVRVMVVQRWRPYHLSQHFIIQTDQSTHVFNRTKSDPTGISEMGFQTAELHFQNSVPTGTRKQGC